MPQIEAGKTVEEFYWDRVREMSPAERVRNSFAMFQSYYNQSAQRIEKANPGISERELRIILADRLYGGDPRTVKLIEMAKKKLNNNDNSSTIEQ
ncbi:MAG: hypothetical protein LBU65_06545 [Planctomycetaceae bacterium]|jgi:hypothetical protein|nr:hypothetical protein [Planctomycetaceae bacterium]